MAGKINNANASSVSLASTLQTSSVSATSSKNGENQAKTLQSSRLSSQSTQVTDREKETRNGDRSKENHMVQWLCDQEKDNRIPHLGAVHRRMKPKATMIEGLQTKEEK
ncbi:hypothetical protein MMC14_005846 [Varicellaria rhodocarpa]|nr:hypothetical protein [Varicellaria rhodocarpa]